MNPEKEIDNENSEIRADILDCLNKAFHTFEKEWTKKGWDIWVEQDFKAYWFWNEEKKKVRLVFRIGADKK